MIESSNEFVLIIFGAIIGTIFSVIPFLLKSWYERKKKFRKMIRSLRIDIKSKFRLLMEYSDSEIKINNDLIKLLFNSGEINTLEQESIEVLIEYNLQIELFNAQIDFEKLLTSHPTFPGVQYIRIKEVKNYEDLLNITKKLIKLINEIRI